MRSLSFYDRPFCHNVTVEFAFTDNIYKFVQLKMYLQPLAYQCYPLHIVFMLNNSPIYLLANTNKDFFALSCMGNIMFYNKFQIVL